jgi:hypothetical protein
MNSGLPDGIAELLFRSRGAMILATWNNRLALQGSLQGGKEMALKLFLNRGSSRGAMPYEAVCTSFNVA